MQNKTIISQFTNYQFVIYYWKMNEEEAEQQTQKIQHWDRKSVGRGFDYENLAENQNYLTFVEIDDNIALQKSPNFQQLQQNIQQSQIQEIKMNQQSFSYDIIDCSHSIIRQMEQKEHRQSQSEYKYPQEQQDEGQKIEQNILQYYNNNNESTIFSVLNLIGLLSEEQGNLPICKKMELANDRFYELKDFTLWKQLCQLIKKEFNGKKQGLQQKQKNLKKQKKGIIKKKNEGRKWEKKVRILEPITVEQLRKNKFRLQEDLLNHLQILCQGFQMLKFCFSKQKVARVKIFFSYDFKFLSWINLKTENLSIKPLQDVRHLAMGINSQNMKQYTKNKSFKLEEDLIFTFIFSDRSLDLQALDEMQKNQFITSYKLVRSFL